jgi:Trypsin
MRLIKTAGACAVIAVAVGGAFASASYADVPSSGAEGPSPLFAKEMAVLTKKGVSPTRARQALDVQGKVARANLVSEVEAAMGSAYAGAWFEPAAAQIHFSVTSEASRHAAQRVAEQAGLADVVTFTRVRSTWAELIAVQDQWDQRLEELVKGQGAMTGLDARRNAVSVTLSSSIPLAERAVLEHEAATASVNVFIRFAPPSHFNVGPAATCKKFKTFEAYCEKTLVSGVGIAPGTKEPECSAGPMLIEGDETYMLTAGHCFAAAFEQEGLVEAKVTSAYPEKEKPEQKEIGKEGKWKYTTDRDMAVVKITRPGSFTQALPTPVPALMAEWGKKTEEAQAVIGEAANVKGETNCHEGMTSGEECGTIVEVNVTIEDKEKNKHKHLVEDTACGEGGDSGGPFFFSESKVNNVHMQGMLSLANKAKECSKGGEGTWYEPLKDEGGVEGFGILSTFPGKPLLTTANEVRPAKLPDISIALGGAYPLHLKFADNSKTTSTLETTAGNKLTGTGVQLALEVSELSASGKFEATFLHVKDEKTACNSSGDKEEEVLTSGEFHIVQLPKEGDGILLSPKEFEITCAKVKVKLKGSVIAALSAGKESEELTEIGAKLEGSKGKNTLTQYLNDSKEEVKAVLEANFGTGFTQTAGTLGEEIKTAASESKMFTITNR